MKFAFYFITLVILPKLLIAQQLNSITPLDNALKETSGLIFLENKLITHNDSGGEPALYEVDSTSGKIIRKVVISNAVNIDWEDISHDNTYIYIGDIGNNRGARTDLKIYRILISDYLHSSSNTVTADIINFSYADQIDFTPSEFNTNFDAEALVAFNDSIYIFTKNWIDQQTKIYAIPKKPGTYKLSTSGTIDSKCLITGAAYNPFAKKIILTGYSTSPLAAFVLELNHSDTNHFLKETIKRFEIKPQGSYQIESIAPLNINQYYLTAEESMTGNSMLYRFEVNNVLGIKTTQETTTIIYPNPATGYLQIQTKNFSEADFYAPQGGIVKSSSQSIIDVSDLAKGIYFVHVRKKGKDKPEIKKLLIQ